MNLPATLAECFSVAILDVNVVTNLAIWWQSGYQPGNLVTNLTIWLPT